MRDRWVLVLLVVVLTGCRAAVPLSEGAAVSPPSDPGDTADETGFGTLADVPDVDAPDGVIVYSGVDPVDGEPSGDLVVALPDGEEIYRAEGRDEPAYAVPTGFPDRAWLVAPTADGLVDVGLLDATSLGVRSLGLPPMAWQLPIPGTARSNGRYAALIVPGEAVALVDVGGGAALLLEVVEAPEVASLSPDGSALLVAGSQTGALVDTADPTRVLPLGDAVPVEWLDGGARLLVQGPPGAGVLTLADGSITPAAVTDVRGAVPSSDDVVLVEVDGQLAVTDLTGAAPTVVAGSVGSPLIVDPGGSSVVMPTPDGWSWVPLDGSGPRVIGPAELQPIAWPGPGGPHVAWFGVPGGRGAPLVGVDLATGQAVTVGTEIGDGAWATFDLDSLELSIDWRTALVPLRNGQRGDLVYMGLDRPASVVASGVGIEGSLSPDASLVVIVTPDEDGVPVVRVGSATGSVVVDVGRGLGPIWLPVGT